MDIQNQNTPVDLLTTQSGTFHIERSLNNEIIAQIIRLTSEDPLIQANTKDYSERFSDQATFEEWLNKAPDRDVFCFLDENDKLACLIWTYSKNIPDYYTRSQVNVLDYTKTFAIRIYQPYRGNGLGEVFMKSVQEAIGYENTWLETNVSNDAARKLYTKFGFVIVERNQLHQTLLMFYNPKIKDTEL